MNTPIVRRFSERLVSLPFVLVVIVLDFINVKFFPSASVFSPFGGLCFGLSAFNVICAWRSASKVEGQATAAKTTGDQIWSGALPKPGAFLLTLLLPKKARCPLLGDLAEEYQEVREQFGERPADLWFYKQVLTSLWPMLQTTGRTLTKWGLVGLLEEIIRRIAH